MSLLVKQLCPSHFEQHPVWATYGDSDDRDEILSWGERGEEILRELEAVSFSDDYYFPLLQLGDAWEGHRGISIRAHVFAGDGTLFPGRVGAGNLYLSLFVSDEEFCFNGNCPDWADETLLRLRQATARHFSPFFPLRYRTDFHTTCGEAIEGFFGYDDQIARFLLENFGVDFQCNDIVRIVSLRLYDRDVYGAETMLRPPQVGDVGRIIRCYDPVHHSASFVVVCVDRPGDFYEIAWHAAFRADELELVSRENTV